MAFRFQATETYKSLRTQTAEYIKSHADDFLPFLHGDDGVNEPDIEAYTRDIENTPRWGGEMEIIALARRHNVAVNVVQAKGETLHFEEQNPKKISLARYEHMYSLGAHFNSLRPK